MCLGIRKPEAMAINAFSLTWNNNDFYMFHPFSIVGWILVTIYRDKANAVVVVPDWSPILVPAVATEDQPGPVVFLAVTKKFDIAAENLASTTC